MQRERVEGGGRGLWGQCSMVVTERESRGGREGTLGTVKHGGYRERE